MEDYSDFQTKRVVIQAKQEESGSWFVRVDKNVFYMTDKVFKKLFEKEYAVEI